MIEFGLDYVPIKITKDPVSDCQSKPFQTIASITTCQLHFYQVVKIITCGKCVSGTSIDCCKHLLTTLKCCPTVREESRVQ